MQSPYVVVIWNTIVNAHIGLMNGEINTFKILVKKNLREDTTEESCM
jgi:hypothetical protein